MDRFIQHPTPISLTTSKAQTQIPKFPRFHQNLMLKFRLDHKTASQTDYGPGRQTKTFETINVKKCSKNFLSALSLILSFSIATRGFKRKKKNEDYYQSFSHNQWNLKLKAMTLNLFNFQLYQVRSAEELKKLFEEDGVLDVLSTVGYCGNPLSPAYESKVMLLRYVLQYLPDD